jgi:ribosomal protein L18E
MALEFSHQILLDIVEAGGKGFEVDDAFEFDYQGQYGILRRQMAHTISY